ncbi:hypothetical protein NG42_19925 [Winslowiella iniecta]|uniref:Uncharacterized protein n=1 Tax=Winslowiella iniecta TaxID=1560201 RepID=A0A0L7SX82_9GAMM|nr:hypothetical protein NG42_19925 [Winslowiella iniecta]KOC88122.1 hypothetical protein NG43_20745 [Winslowiella iniecta]
MRCRMLTVTSPAILFLPPRPVVNLCTFAAKSNAANFLPNSTGFVMLLYALGYGMTWKLLMMIM